MKRSRAVPLLMLGTIVALSGCSGERPEERDLVRQNNYKTLADCHKDWGKDEQECKSSGGGYVGPRYVWSHGAGYPMAIGSGGETRPLPNSYLAKPGSVSTAHSATVTSIGRGGFGASARGFSGGG